MAPGRFTKAQLLATAVIMLTGCMGQTQQATRQTDYPQVISYNGYQLDPATHIVSSPDKEWLQWSRTKNMTVVDAVAKYGGDGWRVATAAEIAALLNDFNLASNYIETFTDIRENQVESVPWTEDEDINSDYSMMFVTLFGNTYSVSGHMPVKADYPSGSSSYYQFTSGNPAEFGKASVIPDSTRNGKHSSMAAFMLVKAFDGKPLKKKNRNVGVALVRAIGDAHR
ncbi:hypothetical protein NF212_03190 [Parasalinivibrio latis]|uniref:hypothetical protein n=1 Tax=Parasalinivibrio latis TaxID=2952610 RepID=UPI0030DFF797